MTATQERLAKKQKVDSELTKARTQLAQMRYHREAMAVAERRGELITKKLVEQQAAYLLIGFRQKMLNLGASWARRFVGLDNMHEAKALIDEMARTTLTELAQFPERVTDPNWLDEVNGNGERPRPASPAKARKVQAKEEAAKARRKVRRRARKEKTGVWV